MWVEVSTVVSSYSECGLRLVLLLVKTAVSLTYSYKVTQLLQHVDVKLELRQP